MSKTVTLRLNDQTYQKFKALAEHDNRPLSNFIVTAVLRYIEEYEYADEFEMAEIKNNKGLNRSIKSALHDVKTRRGHFA